MVEIEERCRAFEEDLSALIDGELGAERRAELEAHLAGCAACSGRIAALRAVDGALVGLPSPAVAPDLRARLARRIAAEDGRRAAPPALRRGRALRLLALPAAAAAALALYLALRAPGPAGGPARPETPPIAKTPAPARVERSPESQVAKAEPATPAVEPAAPAPAPGAAELEALDTEELSVVLDLDTIEDLPVIANLELLERLLGEDAG